MESGGKSMTSAVSMESLNSVSTENGVLNQNVRTLFVSGLPMDAKPRELYLLFRAYHGYESSLLKMTVKSGKPTSPVGFVTFHTKQDADEARKQLQGVRFDPDCAQILRLELAKSNTKVSRPKLSPPGHHMSAGGRGDQMQSHMPFMGSLQHDLIPDIHNQLLLDQQQLLALAGLPQLQHAQALQAAYLPAAAAMQVPQHHAALYAAAAAAAAAAASPPSAPTPACSTLFVANLSPNVVESELREIFKAVQNLTRIRIHTKNGSSVAFVEYSDVRSASQAMLTLQGATVSASDRGGLRIEYARNKMADVNG